MDDSIGASSSLVEENDDMVLGPPHDPSVLLKRRPKKGILKQTISVEIPDTVCAQGDSRRMSMSKGARFDEMNVMATHHPPDKDYGHMKIDEPKTPYSAMSDNEEDRAEVEASGERVRRVSLSEVITGEVDPQLLKRKLLESRNDESPNVKSPVTSDSECLSESELEHKKCFEQKRKKHYNEAAHMKKARELIEKELKEIESLEKRDDAPEPMATS